VLGWYSTLLIECWKTRLDGINDLRITVKFQDGWKTFKKNADELNSTECLFTDDGALPASSRTGKERVALKYQSASNDFGLTVSIPKTMHLVAGREVYDSGKDEIIIVNGRSIESVEGFPYLNSVISSSIRIDTEVEYLCFLCLTKNGIHG